MGKYSFVLTDELYHQYYLFKHQSAYDKEIVSQLLKFRVNEFITNIAQLKRIGIIDHIETSLHSLLRRTGLSCQSLEELVNKTDYKLILSRDNSIYPYVNIYTDPIDNCIIGCYYRDMPRTKAIEHIKALCKGAKQLYLYDKYLFNCYEVLKSILPHRKIEIFCHPNNLTDPKSNTSYESDIRSAFSSHCSEWTLLKDNNIQTHHDRYIVIDNKIEIILTSGFRYLTTTIQELSYIVRPISSNRLIRTI